MSCGKPLECKGTKCDGMCEYTGGNVMKAEYSRLNSAI